MKALSTFFATFFLLTACLSTDKSSSKTVSVLRNQSGQQINISVLRNGLEQEFGQHTILSSTEKTVLEGEGRGKGTTATFSDFLAGKDSVVVLFGNNVKAIHYSRNRVGPNSKAILYDNPRNLFNRNHYVRVILDDQKHFFQDQYTYTFTAQDYQDAQK